MLKDTLISAGKALEHQGAEAAVGNVLEYLEAIHPVILKAAYRTVCQEIDRARPEAVANLMVERDRLLEELLYAS